MATQGEQLDPLVPIGSADPTQVGPTAAAVQDDTVHTSLIWLRDLLGEARFGIPTVSASAGQSLCDDLARQLDDYILPRLATLGAPLLAVVGGSTGSGKSTLVNTLAGALVSRASAIRPTTRRPVLVAHPKDVDWFSDARILPNLARVRGSGADTAAPQPEDQPITELFLTTSEKLPNGLALLDAPDIDSIAKYNRELAGQLMAAADLWIFVTTAHRYADAIPWAMLADAAERNIVVCVVLNRVPPGVGVEVRADLARRLANSGLAHAPLFVIGESEKLQEFLPPADTEAIEGWLHGLSRDAAARASVAKQSLLGALHQIGGSAEPIAHALAEQLQAGESFTQVAESEFARNTQHFAQLLDDGSLLRGEVLQRWQELVGVSRLTSFLENGVSRLRDKLLAPFFSRRADTGAVEVALADTFTEHLVAAADLANAQTLHRWEALTGGTELALEVRALLRNESERNEHAQQLIARWQSSLTELVSEQGEAKKTRAKAVAYGVNAIGVALMMLVFASTGGLVGGEVAVAGGTAVVAQKLLEAVFGDDAVRKLIRQARAQLETVINEFMDADLAAFVQVVEAHAVDADYVNAVQSAFERVTQEVRVLAGGR